MNSFISQVLSIHTREQTRLPSSVAQSACWVMLGAVVTRHPGR